MKDPVATNAAYGPQNAIIVLGEILLHRQFFRDAGLRVEGLTIVRCAEDWDRALSLLQQFTASILIAKQSFLEQLPDTTILQLTRSVRSIRVLAILEDEDPQSGSAVKMLRLGCWGILPARFSSKLLRRAVLAVLHGELWAPRLLVSEMLSDLLRAASLKAETGLTPQEARILELSSRGYTNSAIADALFISPETVRWHKRRLNRKLRGRVPSRQAQKKALPPDQEAAG